MSERGETAWGLWGRNLRIWAALTALLALSCVAAYWPIGAANTVLGLAIAVVKAGLVVVLFMQLGRASNLVRLTAAVGLFWTLILFSLTLADVLSRLYNF